MGTVLQQGGNTTITGAGSTRVLVALDWTPKGVAGMDVDASAFLLTSSGKVRSDSDMVFYNQPRAPEGSVVFENAGATGLSDAQVFTVDCAGMPGAVEKVAFSVTIHDGQARNQSFSQLQQAVIRVLDAGSKSEIAQFPLPLGGASESAMVFGELYLRNGEWKFRAVGQGFAGGLGPLATSFGVDVEGDSGSAPSPSPSPAPAPQPAPAAPPPSSAPVNLSKITLEKKGQGVDLTKKGGAGFGEIVVNLNWTQQAPTNQKRGLFGLGRKGSGGIDLDLCCLFKMRGGPAGAVQALGRNFGSLQDPPYIALDGDDRTGAVTAGENMRINGNQWDNLEKVLVWAMIYEGVPNWAQADGLVSVNAPGQPPLEVRLDYGDNNSRLCAICMLENTGGGLRVTKLAEYFRDAREMDQHYGFGLRWRAGSKD